MTRISTTRGAGLFVALLSVAGCGGGGGDAGAAAAPAPDPVPTTVETDMPRLASAIQMIVATYAGGAAGAAGKTLSGPYRVGDTLPCGGGGTMTVTSTTNSTSNAQYAMRGCVLTMTPTLTFNGVSPGMGDLTAFGPVSAQGVALSLPVQITFLSGGIEGNANPQAGTSIYGLNQNLTKNAVFTMGTQRYVTTDATILGSQSGTGTSAQLSLTAVYGTFQLGGRELRYASSSAVTWGANGPTGGRLVVHDNTTTDATAKLRAYSFSADGTVRVTDAYDAQIGSFAFGGLAFQQALAAAAQ